MKLRKRTVRLIEFLGIGVFMGIAEDLLAVYFSTGESITPRVIWIVFLVALPFAFVSEYVVDHPKFWKTIFKLKEGEEFKDGEDEENIRQ